LEGQSQAGLQIGSQKYPTPRAAMGSDTSGDNSSSVSISVISGEKTSVAPEAPSPATSHSPPITAPQASSASLPATSYSPLATPASPDVVFLAFGQIRDGKNLDLFLRAMPRLPENVKLLVAGKGDSGSSRPAAYYQKLAEELGVADRCRWDIRRIPDEEVGDIFAACDVVLVTYSAKFRSASGVLNAAVSARKPVLASSGPGPLKTVVEKYELGVFVKPDDAEEILRGASKLVPSSATDEPATRHSLLATPPPAWDRYECENSWKENASQVACKMFMIS
jgi:glycosyltransferase involved in cell wall biosynthesis